MQLSDENIEDFSARWKRAFGQDLMRDEARVIAGRVLRLYRELLLRPLPGRQDVEDVAEASTPLSEDRAAQTGPAAS